LWIIERRDVTVRIKIEQRAKDRRRRVKEMLRGQVKEEDRAENQR
jgi:hypothetical protein